MYKYDREQAKQKLAGTVIMYKDKPVYIGDVKQGGGGVVLLAYNLPGYDKEVLLKIDDNNLDGLNFKLGYVNYKGTATYLTRVPRRQYSQGLRSENTSNSLGYNFEQMTRDPSFSENLSGKYPSFEECVKAVESGKNRSQAFHRRFAISKDSELGFYQLEYKSQRIAYGDPENFVLPSHMQYLSEVIRSAGVKIK